jgi:hypothetical protein
MERQSRGTGGRETPGDSGAAEERKSDQKDGADARIFLSMAKIFFLRNAACEPIVQADKRAVE